MATQETIKTQVAIIKAHLLAGQRIDTWQAYSVYGITCLAQRVHDLRKAGISVNGEMVTQNARRFKRYWIDGADCARYVSGEVDMPTNTCGTGGGTVLNDGVWVAHDYIDNLLSALTFTAKSLNLLAQIADIEGDAAAERINDYSMDVLDIAMSLTSEVSNISPPPNSVCVSGAWLSHDYLKSLRLSIDGQANGLGTMATMATLTDTDMNEVVSEGISEVVMSLAELSIYVAEFAPLTQVGASIKGANHQ